nr:RNA-directed DNA polymerase, eukaryota, reverse transcriptase zinc-binding domain protein [Tanacetum cinerariifolium]
MQVQLQSAQRKELEIEVNNDEIKRAVWECGTDKAPGPDGCTFGFFRLFWYFIEQEVYEAQGDPLSPFIFILIMESLHLSFQRVVDEGLFHGIKLHETVKLSHMFYADDVVFVGQWSDSNITSLVHALECFHRVSGLKINMSKSKIMGIHVNDDIISRAADKLGCLVLKTPFLYLGSMVGGAMNRLQTWNDMVDRVRRRLSMWKMKMLSIGGRLTLVKSVLGSMPIYHMSLFKVPAGVIRSLELMRSHFFNGHEMFSRKATWVSLSKVLTPKAKGGLGVSSLFGLNRGLLFKWVWRFLNHGTSLWARVIKAIHGADGNIGGDVKGSSNSCWLTIVKEIKILSTKGSNLMNYMCIRVGNGENTLLWEDNWRDGGILKDRFPRIFALESCKSISVGSKFAQPSFHHSFRRQPRGGAEQMQYAEFVQLMQQVILAPMTDRWIWTLDSSGEFSVASIRNLIDNKLCSENNQQTRWCKYVPIKVNTHAWKVMTNSLATKFNISRRGIEIAIISCVNCDKGVETTTYLFFTCDMAQQVMKLINRWWEVPDMEISSYDSWQNWMVNIRMPSINK